MRRLVLAVGGIKLVWVGALSIALILIEVTAAIPIGIYCANVDCSLSGSRSVQEGLRELLIARVAVVVVVEATIFACAIYFFRATTAALVYSVALASIIPVPIGQLLGLEFVLQSWLENLIASIFAAFAPFVVGVKARKRAK